MRPVNTVFIDRDGVINRMRPDYVKSWDEFEVLPDVVEAIAGLSQHGVIVIVVTNQSAIGRKIVTQESVDQIHQRFAELVTTAGGSIRAFLVCPHRPEDSCDCRKPAPGLYFRAREEFGIDLAAAVMIGDQLSDLAAARAAGCQAILIQADGNHSGAELLGATVVTSLSSAARVIIEQAAGEEAIVLCGGLGTRLRGVLGAVPKSMAQIHGRPFIEWLLLALARQGVRRAVLATGHLSQVIQNHFQAGSRFGVDLAFSSEIAPLGTGGGARLAVEGTRSSRLIVVNGDSYCRFNLDRMRKVHISRDACATLWVQRVDQTGRYGSVRVDRSGNVTGFGEKVGRAGTVSAGAYLVEREVLTKIPANRSVSLEREVFPALVGHGLCAVTGRGPFIDIGTPESLADADSLLGEDIKGLEDFSWTTA